MAFGIGRLFKATAILATLVGVGEALNYFDPTGESRSIWSDSCKQTALQYLQCLMSAGQDMFSGAQCAQYNGMQDGMACMQLLQGLRAAVGNAEVFAEHQQTGPGF
jgi:hypothetical protein